MKDGARIVEIGTRVLPKRDYIYDFSFPKKDGKPNPHLWTDPTYAIKYAEVVRDALSKARPRARERVRRQLRRRSPRRRPRCPTRCAPTRRPSPAAGASC